MSHRIAAITAVLGLLCGIVLHSSSAREPLGSPSDKPIHTAVYALIRDFQAIPDAGPIFVGGDEELYRVGFAPAFSRI